MNRSIQTSNSKIYRDVQNLSKPLRLVTLQARSQLPTEILPEDSSKVTTDRVARKYFSKKVVNLLCFGNSASREASAYRYKAVKTFRMYTSSLRRSSLRLVKEMMVCCPPVSDKKKAPTITNQISAYKALKYLECYGNSSMILFRSLRTLTNLQDLTLDLDAYQVSVNSQTFLGLNTLKRFRLVVKKCVMGNTKDVGDQVFSFCRKLLRKTNLQYVKLDLKQLRYAKDSDLIEGFFSSVIETKALAFDIFFVLSLQDCIHHANNVQALLKTLDILELTFGYVNYVSPDNFRISINNKDPREDPYPYLSQTQKKLSLSFSTLQGDATQQPMSIPTKNSELVKNLKLLDTYLKSSFTHILDYLYIKNLKSLTFKFSSDNTASQLTSLSAILKNSPHLNHLNLKNNSPWEWFNQDSIDKSLLDMISRLENLKHLESLVLQDFEMTASTFQEISKHIEALSNLRVLQFNCLAFGITNHIFSFEMLANLSELQITLPELTTDSQRSFVDNLSKISGLETLEIKTGHLLLRNSKVRFELMKALCGLNKLRKVIIDSVKQQIFFGPLEERETIFCCVRDGLKWLFEKNLSLEMVYVKDENLYEIKYTR